MELTKGQEAALKIAVERYKNKEPYTVIAGFAGTGKSTLVKFIIDALNIKEEELVYIAYTGRASLVLKNKGCENSITAHKLLYDAKAKEDGTFDFNPKPSLDKKYSLIVLDEASMLPVEMWNLLLSHKTHVIAMGDPGQLPPIDGNSTILDSPHVVLTEVVRQALYNPIVRLSMDIRDGKWIAYGGEKACRVMQHDMVSNALLMGADQIICGKNVTRHAINDRIRVIKWQDKYTTNPIDGDKCICLKNEWGKVANNEEALVNGMIGIIKNITYKEDKLYNPYMMADFVSDNNGLYDNLHMDYKIFTEKETTINKDNWKQYPKSTRPYEFDYGYCITCHKSQGSEFDKVIVYDEWIGDKEYHKKWLYTAVTRASKMLVVVK